MSDQNTLKRVNDGFVSGAERRLLIWIAARLPRSFTPDRLTMIGVAGASLTFAGFTASNAGAGWLALAVLGLCVHWFGDSLDGTVARVRAIERPRYGYFLDQTIDVVSNLLIMLGIGFSPYVRMDVALLVAAAYHMISIYALAKAVVVREFDVTIMNFGPTEVRILLILTAAACAAYGPMPLFAWPFAMSLWDLGMLISALVILAMFTLSFIETGRRLLREENGVGD